MPVRPLLLLGHPLLWTPAAPAEPGSSEVLELIADLAATLADFRERKGFGRAIAAPQIGRLVRVVFMNVGEPRALLNPRITARSADEMELWDDCFSFPDLLVRVNRAMQVTLAYEDLKGRPHTLQCEGPMAELMQHEIDHLDGILAVDRAAGLDPFAFRSEWEKYHLPAERYGVPYPREAPDEAIATRL